MRSPISIHEEKGVAREEEASAMRADRYMDTLAVPGNREPISDT